MNTYRNPKAMFVPSERVLDVQVWGRIFTRAELTAARRWRERERRRGNESKREEKRDRRGCMEIDKTDMRDREREGHAKAASKQQARQTEAGSQPENEKIRLKLSRMRWIKIHRGGWGRLVASSTNTPNCRNPPCIWAASSERVYRGFFIHGPKSAGTTGGLQNRAPHRAVRRTGDPHAGYGVVL